MFFLEKKEEKQNFTFLCSRDVGAVSSVRLSWSKNRLQWLVIPFVFSTFSMFFVFFQASSILYYSPLYLLCFKNKFVCFSWFN